MTYLDRIDGAPRVALDPRLYTMLRIALHVEGLDHLIGEDGALDMGEVVFVRRRPPNLDDAQEGLRTAGEMGVRGW